MVRRLISLVGVLALLSGFVACQPAGTATSQATQAIETSTPMVVSTATSVPAPTPTGPAQAAATATPPWQIPEVQDSDWVRGGANAGLTLVEYSDLQ